MNDWQIIVLEELKAINRKIERLNDKLDHDTQFIEGKLDALEDDFYHQINPIKKHVTQVKFTSVLLVTLVPIVIAAYNILN